VSTFEQTATTFAAGSLALQALPHPLLGHPGVPTDPLAFTAAFDPRQFQFGLKINF
jgi:hypothetical protein